MDCDSQQGKGLWQQWSRKTFIILMFWLILSILLDFFIFYFSFPPPLLCLSTLLALWNPIQLLSFFFFSVTFFIAAINMPLHWAFAVLWSFPFLLFSFLFFKFFKLIIFSTFIPLLAFPTVFFPLQLIFYIYKSSLSTSNFTYLFFLSLLSSQHICQFYFHCFIPQLVPCFSFVFQFVL